MNTQNNKKLNKNLNESIEKTFKTIDEYLKRYGILVFNKREQ